MISTEEIKEIQETVDLCQRLSRFELAQTIAENLQWHRASGVNKVDACFKLLEKLESQGVLQLPQKRTVSKPTAKRAIRITEKTEPRPEIVCKLKNLDPVELEVVKDKDVALLWKEYMAWQHYQWVNDIVYYYDRHKRETVHVVVCKESREELDKKTGEIIIKTSRHVWISSKALDRSNLHERCNLAARHRWNIETEILVEKHHGYNYEHCFSYDWNSMRGYHYLMRIGHALNVLAQFSESLIKVMRKKGIRGFIDFFRETIIASLLDTK